MSNTGEYRVSRNALIITGAVMLVIAFGWLLTGFAYGFAILIAIVGLVLLLSGALRPKA